MTIIIKELLEIKVDSLICQDMDRFAHTVPCEHQEHESVQTVDITIHTVEAIAVTPQSITFSFENGNIFTAQVAIDDYYKVEVI